MEITSTSGIIPNIENRIFTIRGLQVMLDSDLAELYGVTTGRFNEQVKRNLNRFPPDFRFQISDLEWTNLLSQFAIASWGGRRSCPFVFTEQGVAGLSGVLRSEIAVNVHIQIMRAFVNMKHQIGHYGMLVGKIRLLESWQTESDQKFQQIFKALENRNALPETGIFFEGEVFDAWAFVSDLVRSAKHSILLIDNYIDDTILKLFTKRAEGVTVTIYTRKLTPQFAMEADKFNKQHGVITLQKLTTSHDRFLIIDDTVLYHIGASLKDLGKKWFAFTRIDSLAPQVLQKLR